MTVIRHCRKDRAHALPHDGQSECRVGPTKKVAPGRETAYFAPVHARRLGRGNAFHMVKPEQPVAIKCDANRRLYRARHGISDVTRSMLKQIILERAYHG
jgi:hypothetical protein